jgi:FKBP-type peptidyl-prolyl cis-trans isomerase
MKLISRSLVGFFPALAGVLIAITVFHLTSWGKDASPTVKVDTAALEPSPQPGTNLAPVVSKAAPLFAGGTNVLSDIESRASYAMGMMYGQNWQPVGLKVDPEFVARGIRDVQSGGTTLLSMQEMHDTLDAYQKEFIAKKHMEVAAKSKAEGEAFLAANKNNPGVVTLPDGLQYKVITNGTGATPTLTDIVTVNYRGTFINGREFDSSAKTGHPAQFPVGGVIRGWTEALTHMKVGSKWQLFVPSELAYGEQGIRDIPPNFVLIFELELLSIQSAPPPAPAASNNPPLTSDIIKVPSPRN